MSPLRALVLLLALPLPIACSDAAPSPAAAPADAGADAEAPPIANECPRATGAGPVLAKVSVAEGYTCTRHPAQLEGAGDVIVARNGDIFVTDHRGKVLRMTAEEAITVTDGLQLAFGLREGPDGSLYVVEPYFGRVVRIQRDTGARTPTPDGIFGRRVGTFIEFDARGRAYVNVAEGPGPIGVLLQIDLTTDPPTTAEFARGLSSPEGHLFDPDGSMMVIERGELEDGTPGRLLRLPPTGGDAAGATVLTSALRGAYGLCRHPRGGYLVAATSDLVWVHEDGRLETILTYLTAASGVAAAPDGEILVMEGVQGTGRRGVGSLIRLRPSRP